MREVWWSFKAWLQFLSVCLWVLLQRGPARVVVRHNERETSLVLDAASWGRSTSTSRILVLTLALTLTLPPTLLLRADFNVTTFNAVGPKAWNARGLDAMGVLQSLGR